MAGCRLWPLVGLLGLLACTGPDEPSADPIPVQPQPGYYYGDQFIVVSVDPTTITFESALPPEPIVAGVLRALDPRPDSITPYIGTQPHHWRVWLSATTLPETATDLARRLRLVPGVQFASTAYLSGGRTGCQLTLDNQLLVKFRPGTSGVAIAALNAQVGATVRQDGSAHLGVWTLAYPVGNVHTPLEVAAYYDRHVLVEWADPDRTGCIRIG
jgi:hypothetical protein